jgi:hypothetical protein
LQISLARHFDSYARILQTIPTDIRNTAYSFRNQGDMQASDLMFDALGALTAFLGKTAGKLGNPNSRYRL